MTTESSAPLFYTACQCRTCTWPLFAVMVHPSCIWTDYLGRHAWRLQIAAMVSFSVKKQPALKLVRQSHCKIMCTLIRSTFIGMHVLFSNRFMILKYFAIFCMMSFDLSFWFCRFMLCFMLAVPPRPSGVNTLRLWKLDRKQSLQQWALHWGQHHRFRQFSA